MERFKRNVKQIVDDLAFNVGDKVLHPKNGIELRVVIEVGNINGTNVMTVAELEPYSIPSLFIVQDGWSLVSAKAT